MNSQTEEAASGGPSSRDTALLVLAVGLLVGGMFAFYYFNPQYNVLIRTLILLGATVAAIVLAAQTFQGKVMWGYVQGSRTELRKVVWPSRQESVQTTLMIAVVVLIMALFLAGVDWVLSTSVHKLVGAKGS
jgi:preprotein translocase subunit SecE